MSALSKLYYRIFKRYRRLEVRFVTWKEGDDMLRKNEGKPDNQQWGIAREEDTNHIIGMVYLERRERILE